MRVRFSFRSGLPFWQAMLLLLLVCGGACGQNSGPDAGQGRHAAQCVTALDGDSLLMEEHGEKYQVRLLGVDCPEKGQEFADKARTASRAFARGKIVELEYGPRRTDRYGRVLAYVWREGQMLNELLVRKGLALAIAHDQGEPHADLLKQAMDMARRDKTGFWSKGGLDRTPAQFRKERKRAGRTP